MTAQKARVFGQSLAEAMCRSQRKALARSPTLQQTPCQCLAWIDKQGTGETTGYGPKPVPCGAKQHEAAEGIYTHAIVSEVMVLTTERNGEQGALLSTGDVITDSGHAELGDIATTVSMSLTHLLKLRTDWAKVAPE